MGLALSKVFVIFLILNIAISFFAKNVNVFFVLLAMYAIVITIWRYLTR